MTIHILADSGCDLPLSYFADNGATFIPLGVNLDGKDYEDGIDIQSTVVYQAMRQGESPKTSQVHQNVSKKYLRIAETTIRRLHCILILKTFRYIPNS